MDGPSRPGRLTASAATRRECLGELVQIDRCDQAWFDDRETGARCSSTRRRRGHAHATLFPGPTAPAAAGRDRTTRFRGPSKRLAHPRVGIPVATGRCLRLCFVRHSTRGISTCSSRCGPLRRQTRDGAVRAYRQYLATFDVEPTGTGTATNVRLSHLVIHDCMTSGVSVSAGGSAAIATATVVNNGTGVESAGTATIKDSLLTGNAVALKGQQEGGLTSSYDDLFGNTTAYVGLAAGTGDLAAAVTFVDAAQHDFALRGPQPSTDQGDPADPVDAERTPNGGRINLGAFAGTADAELSVPAPLSDDTGVLRPTPTATPSAVTSLDGKSPPDDSNLGGCSIPGRPAGRGVAATVVVLLLGSHSRRRRREA